ncbi:asparaginase [Bacillus sp. JJ1773]|uniref:asparaginase n=1 Tax=Bacillus sp. JJ1773 TaxID=3122965 RepID=UPI002FFE28CC
MTKIALLTTGGTIDGISKDRLDLSNYRSGKATHSILDQVPEASSLAEIHHEPFDHISSRDMTPRHWDLIRERIHHYVHNQGFDGVVVTHGTNTMEETAYFLHLTCQTDKPIVLVGSQRPPGGMSSDAHLNLFNSVKLAASPDAKGRGVLVMLNDEINSARDVTKTNTYRTEAFQSGQMGFLGYVDVDGKACFYRHPTKRHTVQSTFASLQTDSLKRVDIIFSYGGADGELIRSLLHTDCKGIVIAGTGAGICTTAEYEALQEAREKGIQVVRSSRVGNGRVVPIAQYESDQFIAGDNLIPQKARILLMLALEITDSPKAIQQIFNEY